MIEFQYKYKNRGTQEVFTSLESIGNTISLDKSRIFRISGLNGKGKSFLMHLLSYAFFGSENELIPERLKEKITYISKNDLEFKIKIFVDKDTVLLSEKKLNEEPLVYEIIKGKKPPPIGNKYFDEKYQLIYDFPQDATGRIEKIKKDVTKINHDIFSNLKESLLEVLELKDKNSMTKDLVKIKNLKKKIEKANEAIEINQRKIDENKKNIEFISKYEFLSELKKINIDLASTDKSLQKKEKELKKTPKVEKPPIRNLTVIRKLNDKIDMYLEKAIRLKRDILDIIDKNNYEVKINISKDIKRFSDLSTDRIICIEDTETNYKNICENILHELKSNEDKLINQEERETKNLLEDLLDSFQRFSNVADDASKSVFNETSQNVINKIKQELNKYNLSESDNDFDTCKDYLNKFIETIQEGVKLTPQINREKSKSGGLSPDYTNYQNLVKKVDSLRSEKSRLTIKAQSLFQDVTRIGEPNLFSYNDLNAIEKLIRAYSANKLISDKNSKEEFEVEKNKYQFINDKLAEEIKENDINLMNEELLPDANYTDEDIQLLKKASEDLTLVVMRFQSIQDCMQNEDNNTDMLGPINNFIIKSLGGRIPYQNEMKQIRDLDIIDRKLYLEDFELGLEDLSTGQSSSVYLAHSLSNIKDKKLLVIFDEIANMDDQSLSPVIARLQEHDSKGLLVFALLARVNNDTEGLQLDYLSGITKNNNGQEQINFINAK